MSRTYRNRPSAPEKASTDTSEAKAENGVSLKCSKCGWMWEYRGRHTVYTNCPNCYTKVKVEEGKEHG